MRPLLTALGLALTLTGPALALDLNAMTPTERDAFRAEVRAYLLDNPEVLMEAIGVLEARQAEAEAATDMTLATANADALFNDGYSYVGGNPDGDITLVEFMDYRCSYCRRAAPEVDALLETDGNIRWVVKELPILGEQSVLAAQFAVAVQQLHGDTVYRDIHDALMAMRGDMTADSLGRLAETLDLDPAPLLERAAGPEVAQVLAENAALAQRMQISGTPTFVLQDQMMRGYVPLSEMQKLVTVVRNDG